MAELELTSSSCSSPRRGPPGTPRVRRRQCHHLHSQVPVFSSQSIPRNVGGVEVAESAKDTTTQTSPFRISLGNDIPKCMYVTGFVTLRIQRAAPSDSKTRPKLSSRIPTRSRLLSVCLPQSVEVSLLRVAPARAQNMRSPRSQKPVLMRAAAAHSAWENYVTFVSLAPKRCTGDAE